MSQDRPKKEKPMTAPLELIIGHIDRHKERKKKQFSMSVKSIDQLDYLYYKMNKKDAHTSYSAIVEQALNSYWALYRFAEEGREKDGNE